MSTTPIYKPDRATALAYATRCITGSVLSCQETSDVAHVLIEDAESLRALREHLAEREALWDETRRENLRLREQLVEARNAANTTTIRMAVEQREIEIREELAAREADVASAVARLNAGVRASIFAAIDAERERQDRKWGPVKRAPFVDPVLLARRPVDHQRICEEHEIPTATRAKFLCDTARERGESSWTSILVEEVCEAVEACTDPVALRTEMVQVGAVVVKFLESLELPEVTP